MLQTLRRKRSYCRSNVKAATEAQGKVKEKGKKTQYFTHEKNPLICILNMQIREHQSSKETK